MNTENFSSNPNRRAQRSYHCYGCQNEWRQLVNPSDLTGVQCPSCQSEFFEETKSYQQIAQVANAAERPASPAQNNLQLPAQQRRTETTQVGPNGQWQRSVTISFGTDGAQPQVTSFSSGGAAAPQGADQFMSQFFGGPAAAGEQNDNGFFGRHQIFGQGSPLEAFFNNSRASQPQSRGCTADFIKNLPQKEEGKDADCYICLEKCSDGEASCTLPCNHSFDRGCIETWLKQNDSCPVCRTKLDQENANQQSQNQEQPEPHQRQQFFQHPFFGAQQHHNHQRLPNMNNFFFF